MDMNRGLGVTLLSVHIAVTMWQTLVVAEVLDCGLQGEYHVKAYLYWQYYYMYRWSWDDANTTCTEDNRLLTTNRNMIEDCVSSLWYLGTWFIWSRRQNGSCYYIRYSGKEFEELKARYCSSKLFIICEDKVTATTQVQISTTQRTITSTTSIIRLSSEEFGSSTTQSLTSVTPREESDSGTAETSTLNGGLIAGIVVGVLLLAVIICVLVVLFRRGKLQIPRRKTQSGVSNNGYQSDFPDRHQNRSYAKGRDCIRTESNVKYQTSNGAVVCNINAVKDTDGTYETAEYFTLEKNNNKGKVEPVYEFASDPSGSIQTYNNAVINDQEQEDPGHTNTYDHINKPTADKVQDHIYSHTEAAPDSEYAHTNVSTKSSNNAGSIADDTYNHVRSQICGSDDYKGYDGENISNNNHTATVMTSIPTDDTYSHVGN